jgi:hypothetical protein
MKKIIGLIGGIIIVIIGFSVKKNHNKVLSEEDALQFYEKFGNKDFSMFECLNLRQWNPKRKSAKEYYIEYYPSCSKGGKPKRANVKYNQNKYSITYQTIDSTSFDENILNDFYKLNASDLLYVDTSTLIIVLYPNLIMKKSCSSKNSEGYTYIENCWYYKINKQ